MGRMVALLRAVNVGGRKLPMAELRALCAALGWEDVATYIQSGNVVFSSGMTPAEAEAALEGAVAKVYGYDAPTIVRTRAEWAELAAGNPFAEAAKTEPNRIQLLVSKDRVKPGAAEAIMAKARAGETVKEAPGALWFHYPEGIGTSKLTPALIDKACGSPTTGRNYRTVQMLLEMLG